eukprot:TRINITY_DN6478_c0_g1_i1.p1 TRINITY_DN6478_c0_g1~~TRINITY_DN6478_c0_g1_i1.p1  ORF type:complete len:248 (+),score=41.63 TRINITY_DN6478_c0_g1_i1:43-786(+)
MDFAFGLSLVNSFLTVFLFLSPGDIIQKIRQAKSSEGFALIPFVCMLANTWLWSWYGLSIQQPVIFFLNATGGIITIYYIFNFYAFVPEKDLLKSNIMIFSVVTLLVMMTGITEFFMGEQASDISGSAAVIANVLALGSPLVNLYRVIKTKSTHTMSFPLALASMVLGILWFFYGYLVEDGYIMAPNALSVCFGAIQLVVYFVFNRCPPSLNAMKDSNSMKKSRSMESLMKDQEPTGSTQQHPGNDD